MSAVPAFEADRWMDNEEAQPPGAHSLRGFLDPALQAPRRLAEFAATTPGMLTIVSTVLVLAILAAGGAMAWSSNSRQDELNTLITRTEPLSNAAQDMFNSLSVADSVATTSFLQSGPSDPKPDRAYRQAIADASDAVIRAASGIENIESREMQLVLQIQDQIPQYVQLVAQAQTNNRMRNPVGAAYLSQASSLMQQQILPAAQELYSRTSSQVNGQQVKIIRPLWFPLSGLVAAIIMLVAAQWWLAGLTNRRINVGYFSATALLALALLFAGTTAALNWHSASAGERGTVGPLDDLTQVRISAQQARTGEALGLVQRDYDASNQSAFSMRIHDIDQTLGRVRSQISNPERVDAARESLRRWDTAHARIVSKIKAGDYEAALALSRSQDNFKTFDGELQELISETRSQLRDVLLAGRSGAQNTAAAVLILTLLAALSTLAGTRPRLQEFL